MRGAAREIVLLDRNRKRAEAVATDMRYGTPLSPVTEIRDGDYDDLAGAALVIITAGVNEKSGGATDRHDPAGRLKLLNENVKLYEQMCPGSCGRRRTPCCSVTDPPDPLATCSTPGRSRAVLTPAPTSIAFGFASSCSGTRREPGFNASPLLGEHGTSQVFLGHPPCRRGCGPGGDRTAR